MNRRGCRLAVAAAAVGFIAFGYAPQGGCADAPPQGGTLAVNPLLQRRIPPAGWIGAHRDVWVEQHAAAYQARCRTREVVAEIEYWNWVIGFDDHVLDTTDAGDHGGDPAAAARAKFATELIEKVHGDIAAADSLTAQLAALPACAATAAMPSPAPVAAAIPPPASPATLPGAAPAPASTTPAPPAPAPTTPAPPADALAPTEAISAAPIATSPQRLVIRFEDRKPALTPSGLRAFRQAVDAEHAGQPVALAIDGCDPGADFSNGSPCARRRASLIALLAESGVRDPKRLFPDLR